MHYCDRNLYKIANAGEVHVLVMSEKKDLGIMM
jgi:hypothetical protein